MRTFRIWDRELIDYPTFKTQYYLAEVTINKPRHGETFGDIRIQRAHAPGWQYLSQPPYGWGHRPGQKQFDTCDPVISNLVATKGVWKFHVLIPVDAVKWKVDIHYFYWRPVSYFLSQLSAMTHLSLPFADEEHIQASSPIWSIPTRDATQDKAIEKN